MLQRITLIATLGVNLGLPMMASAYVHSHMTLYACLVAASILLHAIMPSIFAGPSQADVTATQGVKIGVFLLCLLLVLTATPVAYAQTVVAPAPAASSAAPVLPTNIYAAGVSYNVGGSPAVAGTGLYARLVSASTGTYAFTVVDALPNTQQKYTVNTNLGVGIAQQVATIAKVPIYIPTSAGVSYTGANTGWAWSTGGMAVIGLKGGYKVMPNVRLVKSSVSNGSGYQPVIGVLFGWGQ